MNDFWKQTETPIVIVGLIMTMLFGKIFAFVTLVLYIAVNIPTLWKKIEDWLDKYI